MGMAGLMRSLPLHRARGQCFLPRDILDRHGLTPANLIAGRPEEKLTVAIGELRTIALERLEEARSNRAAVAPSVFPAFLPVALTEPYLDRLKELAARSLTSDAGISQLRKQWRLYWCARRKVF
jgi:phytoene synthase